MGALRNEMAADWADLIGRKARLMTRLWIVGAVRIPVEA